MQLRSTIVNIRVYEKIMKEKHANFYAKTCGTFIHKKIYACIPGCTLHLTFFVIVLYVIAVVRGVGRLSAPTV